MFQIHAIAENCLKFQRIRQISLNSPTDAANYAKFAPIIINPFILHFRGLPRQRTLKNSSELCKFHAVHPQLPRITRNSHHLLTHYIVCFICLTSGRELPRIPASQAKFAQFAHRSSEFHTFHIKIHPYLVTSFRSLTIDREPQKIGANQPDFMQFHNSHELREIH